MSTVPVDFQVLEQPTSGPPSGGRSWMAVIERRRGAILVAAIVGALAGELAANVLPATYEASGRLVIVPVDDPTAAVGTNAFDAANATLPLVVAVLRSRRIAEETVAELHLDAAWRVAPSVARKRLIGGLEVVTDRKSNMLTVSFEDRHPARARSVVAAIAERATAISKDLWSRRNREHRQKLEADLASVEAQLTTAQDAFRAFREKTHVVDLAAQTKATVEQAAALERLRIDKTLDVRFARAFGHNDAIEVQKGVHEREAAVTELDGLRHGGSFIGPLLPLDDLPRLEVEHARLKRTVDELAERHELLALKVSQLLAAEARPGGLAEVVDPPLEPTTPSGPPLLKLIAAGALFGALLAAGVVLLLGTRRRPMPRVA